MLRFDVGQGTPPDSACSARADRGFLTISCGAIPATPIEAELFGYEKGRFTGATRAHDGIAGRASGGTLFLDEITEMPLEIQAPRSSWVAASSRYITSSISTPASRAKPSGRRIAYDAHSDRR